MTITLPPPSPTLPTLLHTAALRDLRERPDPQAALPYTLHVESEECNAREVFFGGGLRVEFLLKTDSGYPKDTVSFSFATVSVFFFLFSNFVSLAGTFCACFF